MRLGVDITPLQVRSPGGIGTSLYETLRALEKVSEGHEVFLYARSMPFIPFSDSPLDLDIPLRLSRGGMSSAGNIAWLQYGLGATLRKDGIDAFWGTRHVLPRNARGVALIATAYDFWYARHPEQQPFLNRVLNRYVTRSMMNDAHTVTAISDATAADAKLLFPASADRVRTVMLGVNGEIFAPQSAASITDTREALGIDPRYVLAMDVYNPRKNFVTVLEGCARAVASSGPFDIVAMGRPRATAAALDIMAVARSLGLEENLKLVGDVSPQELTRLYSGAQAFVYPSIYEGFGMPVLEAMACGAPVVCSDSSSLPQVAGNAALLVDPRSVDQIGDALAVLLGDPELSERLVIAGRQRAAELTWDSTARGMLAAFEDALEVARRGGS